MSEPGHPTSIGQYPIERELGRGGMGVVYLARDPRLNRPVAIKVLPAAFVADPVRLQRFEREARTLAALNHRNVAMIFGLEDADSQRLLVLEFVPGQTLTQRVSRGPLPLDECLRTCIQIAEGLEAAHERDVVHRDLKPDNVKVTPDGLVKILDFGLATTTAQNTDDHATTGSALTVAGMVMGTPGYMSPEQARGVQTDKRTDVWAFGCVLYECLSGYRAFGGETVGDCIAAIIDREPDYSYLPARTPNRIRELLRRCLAKDPRRRLRDIGDARIEMEDVLAQPQSGWYQAAGTGSASRPGATARLVMPLTPGPGLPEAPVANAARPSIAVSPDGASVAIVIGRPPQTTLCLRRMDSTEARAIPGTAGAEGPFFSADGARVGFFAEGRLKRVAITGGAPMILAAAPRPQGGCFDSADNIYFVPDWGKPLVRVGPQGGTSDVVAQPDAALGELALLHPEVLPGAKHALVSVWTGSGHDESVITAIDLRTGQRKPLVHGGTCPRYLSSGHLVFARAGSLFAVALDAEKVEVFGQPIPVEDRVLSNALGGVAHFGAGVDGTLVYAQGAVYEPRAALLLSGRGPEPLPLTSDQRPFVAPAVSPSGRMLCVQAHGATDSLWLYDLERPGSPGTRLTTSADAAWPAWSPDGTRLVVRSGQGGKYGLAIIRPDSVSGSAPVTGGLLEPLPFGDATASPCCFAGAHAGGRAVVYTQARPAPAQGLEIWSATLDDASSAACIVQSGASAWGASVSPDGRYLAFVSDETGRPEVYVQSFPAGGGRRQVSSEGAAAPLWARSGGELYYRTLPAADGTGSIIAVRVAVEPSFMVGRPRVLFQGAAAAATPQTRNYDVLSDGQFVLVRAQDDPSRVTSLNVVLNWFTELRRRVPVPQQTMQTQVTRSSHAGHTPFGSTMPTRTATPGQVSQTPNPPIGPDVSQFSPPSPPPPPPQRPSFPTSADTIG